MNPRDLIKKLEQEDAAGLDTSDALSALYQTDEPAQITSISALDQSIMRQAQEQIQPTPWWLKVGGFATAATVLLAVVISVDVQQRSSSPASIPSQPLPGLALEQDAAAVAASNPKQADANHNTLHNRPPDAAMPINLAPLQASQEAAPYTATAEINRSLALQAQDKTAPVNAAAESTSRAPAALKQQTKPPPVPAAALMAASPLPSRMDNDGQLEEVIVTASKRLAPPVAHKDTPNYARGLSLANQQQLHLAELKPLLEQYIQQQADQNRSTSHLLDLLLAYQRHYGKTKLHAGLPRLSQQKALLLLLSKAQPSRLPAAITTED